MQIESVKLRTFVLVHIQIRQGLRQGLRQGQRLSSNGSPVQNHPSEAHVASSVAILGSDFPKFRPAMEVVQGEFVTAGQVVCRDRKHRKVAFVTPVSGRVTSIDYGPRRTLSAVVIENKAMDDQAPEAVQIDRSSDEAVRQLLLERGLWPAFRTRPFGCIPSPEARPDAIFVNATRTSLLAPDPWVVLKKQSDDFHLGVDLLTRLSDGKVYVCQAPDKALCPVSERVQVAFFSGSSASGLSGTHINRLQRVSIETQVWSIGYQDVAAIGHLFRTGNYLADRVVSIAGPRAARPRLIQTCLGASIQEISKDEVVLEDGDRSTRIISGDTLTGRDAAFLGRFHDQITITEKMPGNILGKWVSRLSSTQSAIMPTDALERALAIDVLPVPLMRALSVGDTEAAKRLGCLELVEEDVAALSYFCTSGSDYGTLLRQVLDELREDAA